MSLWVADTSSLIFLAHLDRLDLLRREAGDVLVPPAVMHELRAKPDAASEKIDALDWLTIVSPRDRKVLEVLRLDLDAGEAEAIALAYERSADRTLMDDLAGRRFARRLGLPLIGTVGLLLAARLRGEIPSLSEEIGRLRDAGFFVGEALVAQVLKAAGE